MTIDFTKARIKLVESLSHEIKDKRVLGVMERIPRELFVPNHYQHAAYENKALPIDMGQTISQPLMVAIMTEALDLDGSEKVLEIGTGSGYQAAILAELAQCVITIERHPELANRAKETLHKLGYINIDVHLAEKMLGWRKEAPYDAIIVSAGAPKVPKELINQLSPNGRLVIPVGSRDEQELLKVTRHNNKTTTKELGPCRWVPLIGNEAWSSH